MSEMHLPPWLHRYQRYVTLFRSILRLAGLAFYTMLCMGIGLFILILPPERRRRANMMLIQFWSRLLCLLFGLRVRTEGEPLPHQAGYLVVANHMSYFDIIILGSVIPGVFISKSAVRYWPILGLASLMVGTLFVDRSSKDSRASLRERAKQRLDQGQNITIFPEGTTSDGRTLLPFRYGAFEIAMRADRPVLPVALNYDDPETIMWSENVTFLRHIIGVGRKDHIDVRVYIGKLIGPKSYKTSVEMSNAAWQEINAKLVHFGMRTAAQLATIKWKEFRLPPDPTNEEITEFMTRTLSLLVQVDSSTSPGERQVCQILSKILDVNGHSSRMILSTAGHTNLIATKGRPPASALDKKRCFVVLLGNSDVVPTDPMGWEHPPFSGALNEDFIWGRGTIDMKGLLTAQLTAFLTSDKDAPVHFLCLADEERGGKEGAGFIADTMLEELNAKVLIGEGGFGITDLLGSEVPVFMVDTAEKASLWLRLTVKMKTSAHSAAPPEEYPLHLVMRAVDRATRLESDLILLPVTEKFLASISQRSGLISRIVNQALQMPIIGNQLRRPLDDIPFVRSMFRNTVAVTQVLGAEVENVLAQQAQAILDCRLLPGISVDAFINHLNRAIHDDRVSLEVSHYSPHNETSFNDDNFRKLRQSIEEECPGAIVAPILFPAHTSLGFFREKGLPCFGIFPALFKQDAMNLLHGVDERVSRQQLLLAYRVVRNFINRYSDN